MTLFWKKWTKKNTILKSHDPSPPPPYDHSIKSKWLQNVQNIRNNIVPNEYIESMDNLLNYVINIINQVTLKGYTCYHFHFYKTNRVSEWTMHHSSKNICLRDGFSRDFFWYLHDHGARAFEKKFKDLTGITITLRNGKTDLTITEMTHVRVQYIVWTVNLFK